MKFTLSALALTFWCALTAAAPTPDPDVNDIDWSKVAITSVNYAGSGCKAGTVAVSPSTDWTKVTFAFDSYVASIGPGEKFSERRKNCNINVNIKVPQGYSYTVYTTDYIGRADLEEKVKATQQSHYWFAGIQGPKATLKSTFQGPINKLYTFSDTLVDAQCVWSPCGDTATLNIDTELFLESSDKTKSGYITTDVIDHSVKTIYKLRWRKCKK